MEVDSGWENASIIHRAELFFKYASDAQLDYVSPVRKLIYETFDAELNIEATSNRRMLSAIDPQRMARRSNLPGPMILFCPTNSSRVRGRIRAARGAVFSSVFSRLCSNKSMCLLYSPKLRLASFTRKIGG